MSEQTPKGYEGPDAEAELLAREPPPRVARALSNFLIAVFGAIVAFAALVPLPESVRCRFILAPEGGSAPVMAPEAGVVHEVHAQLGQTVAAGDVLARIVPYVPSLVSQAELKARQERLEAERAAAMRLETQLAQRHDSRVAELRSDLARAEIGVAAANARVETLARLVEQAEAATRLGALAQSELLERKEEMQDAEVDLAEAARAQAAARGALEALEASRHVEIAERQLVRQGMEGELAEVLAGVMTPAEAGGARRADTQIAVIAPYDGVIVAMPVERPGVVVERGQALVHLTRPGAKLRAEMAIPERGAARVVQGQGVRLLFDAYPYTRHGVMRGVLSWVSPAAQGGQLAAFARLEDATVVVDEQRQALRPGMGGEARIDTGSRTMLEYVFEPLQKMREALQPGSASAG